MGLPSESAGRKLEPIEVKAEITELGACTRKLVLTVPATEAGKLYEGALKKLASHANVPGFRRGKAPRAYLEKAVRAPLREYVVNEAVERALYSVGKTQNLRLVGEAKVERQSIAFEPGQDLRFEAEVEVWPSFQLGNYKGLPVEQIEVEVYPEDVDKALQSFAERYAELKEAPADATAQPGDFVHVYLRYVSNDRVLHQVEDTRLSVTPTGIMIPFVDMLTNMAVDAKVAEKRSGEVVLNDSFPLAEYRGKAVTLEMVVRKILRPTPPPVDDALARRFNQPDLATLRERLTEQIRAQLAEDVHNNLVLELLNRLAAATPFELPPRLLAEYGKDRSEGSLARLAKLGFPRDLIAEREQGLRRDERSRAERDLRHLFVLEAICEQEKLDVADEELDQELVNQARQRGMRAAQLYEQMSESGELESLKHRLLITKALNLLVDSAEVTIVPRKRHGQAEEEPTEEPVAAPGPQAVEPAAQAAPAAGGSAPGGPVASGQAPGEAAPPAAPAEAAPQGAEQAPGRPGPGPAAPDGAAPGVA